MCVLLWLVPFESELGLQTDRKVEKRRLDKELEQQLEIVADQQETLAKTEQKCARVADCRIAAVVGCRCRRICWTMLCMQFGAVFQGES